MQEWQKMALFLTRRPRQHTNTRYKAANIENEYSGAAPLFHRLERTLSCLDTLKCMNINNMSYVNQDSAFWYWKVSSNLFYVNLGPF